MHEVPRQGYQVLRLSTCQVRQEAGDSMKNQLWDWAGMSQDSKSMFASLWAFCREFRVTASSNDTRKYRVTWNSLGNSGYADHHAAPNSMGPFWALFNADGGKSWGRPTFCLTLFQSLSRANGPARSRGDCWLRKEASRYMAPHPVQKALRNS